jgi:hypothetical protein
MLWTEQLAETNICYTQILGFTCGEGHHKLPKAARIRLFLYLLGLTGCVF